MTTATQVRRTLVVAVSTVLLGGCASLTTTVTDAVGRPRPARAGAVAVVSPAATSAMTDDPTAPVSDRRVFVEGDSLTVGIADTLPPLLAAAGWTVTMDDQVGRATDAGISILYSRTAQIGGTLVVALGTNDMPDGLAFSSRIDQVMTIASGRRVIWVTVARAGWDVLDEALFAAEARWPNMHVIDWRPVIAAYPYLQASDGIHLTTAGYQLRAQFIAGAVESAG